MAFTAVVGTRVIPRVLDHVADTRSRELFTLTVLVIALGIAVGSALDLQRVDGARRLSRRHGRRAIGVQPEGCIRCVADARRLRRALLRVGRHAAGPALPARGARPDRWERSRSCCVGKPLVALVIVWAMRYPLKVALTVAIALAQIGEFSFILSTIGRELGILTTAATNTLVAVSIVSIVLNPLLYRAVEPVERWIAARPRLWRAAEPRGAVAGRRGGAERHPTPRVPRTGPS